MAMAILLSGIQFSAFHYSNRFVQVEQVMEHSSETWNEDRLKTETVVAEDNSTSTRIRLWKNALQLISMHPLLGVGTGDIKDELKSEYALNNYRYGVDGDLNPHNQYLHTTVMLGLFGLLFLLIFLFMPAFEALKFRNWTYATFLLIIILNAFTESIMEVQKGILFIVYFQVLLYLHMKYDGRLEPVNTPH
jgi:O-antigen ligase